MPKSKFAHALLTLLFTALLCAAAGSDAQAQQQVTTSVPLHNGGSSFYEGSNIGWSLQGPNWFANFGGGAPLIPPFVPFDGNGGLSGGVGGNLGGGVTGRLNFNFFQGSSRSISSTTPSLTTMDGVPGSIQSTVIRPFVTGITPVVGGYPTIPSPTAATNQATEQTLSDVRASEAKRYSQKLQQYLHRIEIAESENNKRMARANYRSAIAVAPEPLRSELQKRLKKLFQD